MLAPLVQWFSYKYSASSKTNPEFNHNGNVELHYFDETAKKETRVKQEIAFKFNTKVKKLPKDLKIKIKN